MSCTVKVVIDALGLETYKVMFSLPEGKQATIFTKQPDEAVGILTDSGVEKNEAKKAIVDLEEKGHNWAEFGFLGSLIFTTYDGVAQ